MHTKETLIGATVVLLGTTTGAISAFDGNFLIEKVAKGSYNLVISYISYDNQIIRAEVTDGGETTVNIELKSASVDIDEVQIVAKMLHLNTFAEDFQCSLTFAFVAFGT
jgi:hypothetical protein